MKPVFIINVAVVPHYETGFHTVCLVGVLC
jgi:hypothetical protein